MYTNVSKDAAKRCGANGTTKYGSLYLRKRTLNSMMVVLFCMAGFSTFASYLKNVPVTLTQPDGTEVHCFATGDEFYHWIHDENGFTLIRDPRTGIVVYAALQNDELVSTNYRVGSIDPVSLDLEPWTIVSAEKRMLRRENFLSKMPEREQLPEGANRNTGTLNNLAIYVRFSDETEFPAKANSYIDMFNKDASNFPSQYAYFKSMSNGQLSIPTTFFPTASGNTILSYQDTYPRSYFQPYSTSNSNGYKSEQEGATRLHQMLRRSIVSVSSQIPGSLNLDFNNDGLVDNICFIVRGATDGWSDMLWPHRWQLGYADAIFINGKRVWDYNLQLELMLDQVGGSVLAHEMFHTLGAPDLYRYNNQTIDPVGLWDLMNMNTTPPQSSVAYMKYKYGGWFNNIPEITQPGTYTLNNVCAESNNAYKIASPNSSTEFFVIEYRDKNVYWDSGLPGSGLIIYRVNTTAGDGNADGPPDEVYIFRQGGNNNTTDGNINNAHFSSQTGRTVFNDSSSPPCFLSNNQPGGISISNIGASGGATMSFDVDLAGGCPASTNMSVNYNGNCEAQITWSAPGAKILSIKQEEENNDVENVFEKLSVPKGAILSSASVHGKKPVLTENNPENGRGEGWYGWCGANVDAIGTGGTAEFIVVARFLPSDLSNAGITNNDVIKKIRFVPCSVNYLYSITMLIYQGGASPTNPGTIVCQQPVTQSLTDYVYNEVTLTTPYAINASQELWIGYAIQTYGGYPAGCDGGPRVVDKGDIMYWGGWTNMYQATAGGMSANWNIEALVETSGSGDEETKYNVYRDGTIIASNIIETTYLDKGFSPYEKHTWTVKAICESGGESSPASVTKESCMVGIDEWRMENGEWRIFPNPTDGVLRITGYRHSVLDTESPANMGGLRVEPAMTITGIKIFDVMGRVMTIVETDNYPSLQPNAHTLNLSHLPAGIYFIRITTENETVVVKKIIKQ